MSISPQPAPLYPRVSAPAVTFILHDAGETKALTPVMQNLDQAGIDYYILANSTGKALIQANPQANPHLAPTPEEIASVGQTDPNRAQWMTQQRQRAIQAKVCVTGLVSNFQKQWANFFRQTDRRVIGYYDGFRYNYNPSNNPASAFKDALTELLTPSQDTANYFRANGFNPTPVLAVGQPTLENTPSEVQGINPALLAQQLGLNRTQPTLLWIGQYGSDYERAFALFCQAAQQLPNANLLIALHPKSEVDGSFERHMLMQAGLQNRVRMLPKSIPTTAALTVADVVLTHHSTMATEAYVQGKKVVFVGPDRENAFEPLERYGQAKRCINPAALLTTIDGALRTSPAANNLTMNLQRQNLLGIPAHACANIANYITSVLKSGQARNAAA